MIKDLLTLADLERAAPSRFILCHLRPLLEESAAFLQEVYPQAKLSIEPAEGGDVQIVADPDLLELAIFNLLENAAKYSKPPAYITLSFQQRKGRVEISVKDQGIGIPEADQEYIFNRFYTVDKAHSQKMGGSGLGLSIVKTIVEKH